MVGCAGQVGSSTYENMDSFSSFDGHALFRGIVFGNGPAANLIPEIRDNYRLDMIITDPHERDLVLEFYARLEQMIDAQDPTFFDNFTKVMHSNDRVAIDAELQKAASMAWTAYTQSPEFTKAVERYPELANGPDGAAQVANEIGTQQAPTAARTTKTPGGKVGPVEANPQTGGFGIACAAYFAVVVHNTVAITAAAAVVVVLKFWVRQTVETAANDRLLRERIVNSIATRLSKRAVI
jgi:SdpC family antimicrobial peptide